MPQATGLAAELKSSLDIDLQLVPGGKGDFEVTLDGKTVFSKHQANRFPELGEITKLIRNLQLAE